MKFIVTIILASAACVIGTPIEPVEPITPSFDAQNDVRFLLSTRSNRNNAQVLRVNNTNDIRSSPFDPSKPLRVLIHGWNEDYTSDISTETSAELLNYYDFNVIFVDWSEGAQTINYFAAVRRVPAVGELVASYLDFLHSIGALNFERTTVIGFSLGAHIAGMTGKNVKRGVLNSIIGLDPAGPSFSVRRPEERIDAGDARYVECMHTNGPTIVLVGAGIGAPIGHADFFPNGGSSQPGCLTNTCSHLRAVDLYVESIANNAFYALQCEQRDSISSRRCQISPGAWMGGDDLNFSKSLRGSYYLDTNRRSPFAQGPVRT